MRSTTAMVTGVLAAIERNAPRQSYTDAAHLIARTTQGGLASTPITVDLLLGVLQGVRQDIEAGYLRDLEARVRDDLAGDLLETAESVLELHAAPAIVLAVSVLEEHVRALCAADGIDTLRADGKHRSFEKMITDLYKATKITLPELKAMGHWYGERTAAAHGRFDDVTADEAPSIIRGVRDFIVRHPQ